MFKRRFTFVGPDDVTETDVLIIPSSEWPSRPEASSGLWLPTLWQDGPDTFVVAVRDATRAPGALGIEIPHGHRATERRLRPA